MKIAINRNGLGCYFIATVLFFVLLAVMPMNQATTDQILLNFYMLTLGYALGTGLSFRCFGRNEVSLIVPFFAFIGGAM